MLYILPIIAYLIVGLAVAAFYPGYASLTKVLKITLLWLPGAYSDRVFYFMDR